MLDFDISERVKGYPVSGTDEAPRLPENEVLLRPFQRHTRKSRGGLRVSKKLAKERLQVMREETGAATKERQ